MPTKRNCTKSNTSPTKTMSETKSRDITFEDCADAAVDLVFNNFLFENIEDLEEKHWSEVLQLSKWQILDNEDPIMVKYGYDSTVTGLQKYIKKFYFNFCNNNNNEIVEYIEPFSVNQTTKHQNINSLLTMENIEKHQQHCNSAIDITDNDLDNNIDLQIHSDEFNNNDNDDGLSMEDETLIHQNDINNTENNDNEKDILSHASSTSSSISSSCSSSSEALSTKSNNSTTLDFPKVSRCGPLSYKKRSRKSYEKPSYDESNSNRNIDTPDFIKTNDDNEVQLLSSPSNNSIQRKKSKKRMDEKYKEHDKLKLADLIIPGKNDNVDESMDTTMSSTISPKMHCSSSKFQRKLLKLSSPIDINSEMFQSPIPISKSTNIKKSPNIDSEVIDKVIYDSKIANSGISGKEAANAISTLQLQLKFDKLRNKLKTVDAEKTEILSLRHAELDNKDEIIKEQEKVIHKLTQEKYAMEKTACSLSSKLEQTISVMNDTNKMHSDEIQQHTVQVEKYKQQMENEQKKSKEIRKLVTSMIVSSQSDEDL
jgi:hypothetical protein